MAHKYSRQREIIKQFLKNRTDHPTADIVYMNVRQEIPNISLGTVYRNLMLLADLGEINKIQVGGTVRFDPMTSDHNHFICTECDAVADLPSLPDDARLDEAAQRCCTGRIDRHRINFYGVCSACLARNAVSHTA